MLDYEHVLKSLSRFLEGLFFRVPRIPLVLVEIIGKMEIVMIANVTISIFTSHPPRPPLLLVR